MMTQNPLSIEDLALLPEEIKRQLIDYAEFLLQKHANNQKELEPKIKALLEERQNLYQSNKLETFESSEVEDKLTKKYKYNV